MRDIFAQYGGFGLSDLKMEDKFIAKKEFKAARGGPSSKTGEKKKN